MEIISENHTKLENHLCFDHLNSSLDRNGKSITHFNECRKISHTRYPK